MQTAAETLEAIRQQMMTKLQSLTTPALCTVYESLNDRRDPALPVLRAAITEVLESRDPESCQAWDDTMDPSLICKPSAFFCH